jgi:NhaP-type Na+/H+ or K+/H+ antiporter
MGGFLAVTGSQWCGYPGAGPLACIISAFVAGTGWRKRSSQHKQNNSVISADRVDEDGEELEDDELPVVQVFEHAWTCLQPVLFAFIGTDLKFELLKRGDMIFLGLLVLAFGLTVSHVYKLNYIIGIDM